jgi:selenocysteine lyase/cysteine desulfurase
LVSFVIEGMDVHEVARRLWAEGPVRVRIVGEYGYNFMRLSTHVYNGPDQIERVVGLLRAITTA